MMRVALSGGIASGKTAVTNAIAEYGIPIIDTDVLARNVVAPDTAGLQKVVDRFGADILNEHSGLNRKALGAIVFADDNARKDLEAIVHPLIRDLTEQRLKQHEAEGADYCVIAIPLLIETGQQDHYDHVVIVDVEPKVQIRRVMARDSCSKEHAENIIASQTSRESRFAIADDLILNSSTIKALDLQVKKLHERLIRLAKRMKKPT